MVGDEVDDALLDVRPDACLRGVAGRRAGQVRDAGRDLGRGAGELAHVGHRHDDLQVPLLRRDRLDDLDGPAAGEVAGHLLDRADRGGETDALGGRGQDRVESLEGQGEVGATLGAGDGVHLVEDDGPHPLEGFAGRRGEHEEE